MNPFFVIGRAFRLWWDELVIMLVLNVVWLLLQLPVVTSAPATAVLYAMAQRSYQGEYWGLQDAWEAWRKLFWPAWRWGLVNGLLLLIAFSNLWVYWEVAGVMWQVLRVVWALGVMILLALNLFYWPFWLAQQDKSLRTTYANCGRFLLLNPAASLVIILVCACLVVIGVLTTLPLMMALTCWLALIGTTAVQNALSHVKREQLLSLSGIEPQRHEGTKING